MFLVTSRSRQSVGQKSLKFSKEILRLTIKLCPKHLSGNLIVHLYLIILLIPHKKALINFHFGQEMYNLKILKTS